MATWSHLPPRTVRSHSPLEWAQALPTMFKEQMNNQILPVWIPCNGQHEVTSLVSEEPCSSCSEGTQPVWERMREINPSGGKLSRKDSKA